MNKILSILLILFSINGTFAQCFQIETILADACGDPEGENEMLVLKTLQPIDAANLVVDWPNNSFLNWCDDPVLTNSLNQRIVSSCGLLLDPPNSLIPAGQKILIVTSTNMLINANSFDGLTDTLYILYQCAGNTWGHFSNGANGTRTLTVSYNGNCIGSQSVNYKPTDLLGGDGAAIFYDNAGNGTYFNTGCNAPVPSINPNWDFPRVLCNSYNTLDLDEFLPPNTISNGNWSGDIENGHFFNPTNKLGIYSVTYTVNDPNACLVSVDSTIKILVEAPKVGYDTIVVCDSINQFNTWLTEDTIVDILINYNNEYICDSTIVRYYFINKVPYDINPKSIVLESDETHVFGIEGLGNYIYSISSNLGFSCDFPCDETELLPESETIFTIIIEDQDNLCTKKIDLNLSILYEPVLNIPNTFTPNGDGKNDNFKIYTEDIESAIFTIYDNWGGVMFQSKNKDDFWNGKVKAKQVNSGSYVIQVVAMGKDGKEYKELKTLNLVR